MRYLTTIDPQELETSDLGKLFEKLNLTLPKKRNNRTAYPDEILSFNDWNNHINKTATEQRYVSS